MPLLPDGRGALLEEPDYFGPRTFLRSALQRFPQLAEDLDDGSGVHLTMAALGRFAVVAVGRGDVGRAHAIVQFVEEVLAQPRLDPEIRNAVAISFVDPIDLEDSEAGRAFLNSLSAGIRELLT
jgi:hypothetical protein